MPQITFLLLQNTHHISFWAFLTVVFYGTSVEQHASMLNLDCFDLFPKVDLGIFFNHASTTIE